MIKAIIVLIVLLIYVFSLNTNPRLLYKISFMYPLLIAITGIPLRVHSKITSGSASVNVDGNNNKSI